MDFQVEAHSERFDPQDDRWLSQVTQLVAELHRETGTVSRHSELHPGQKGGLGTIILALGSAGALTAAVEVIKAFVSRDHGRGVRLSWHQGGQLESVEISGRGIDDAVMARVVGALDRPQGTSG